MTDRRPERLTREAIVDAAIVVADRSGLAALSMRRIAEELGTGAMSLYRHVADKDALLAAMAAEIGRRYPYPTDTSPDWRDRVEIAVDTDWRLYEAHPWVVVVYAAPRYSTPDSFEGLDWLAAGFAELGVDVVRATGMALSVWNLVNGVALSAVSESLLADAKDKHTADGDAGRSGGLGGMLGGILGDIPGGVADHDLPFLSGLADHDDASRLTDLRASLDDAVGYLCDGFAARGR